MTKERFVEILQEEGITDSAAIQSQWEGTTTGRFSVRPEDMTEKHLRDFVKIKIKLDKEAVEWQADTRRQQEASKAKLAEPRRLRMFERDMTRIHAEIFERLQTLIQQSKPVLPDPYDQADRAIAWSGDLREIHAVVIRRFIVQSAAFCRFAVIGAGIAGFLIGLFLRSG